MITKRKITRPVELPSNDLLAPSELANGIANAIYPTNPGDITGIECITGLAYKGTDGADGWSDKSLKNLKIATDKKREYSFAFPLPENPDDYNFLTGLLPKLPCLQHPVPDETQRAFLTAFRTLAKEVKWEPCFVDETYLTRHREEAFQEHLMALSRAAQDGRICICDANRVPLPELCHGAFITRESAISYLQTIGMQAISTPESTKEEDDWNCYDYTSKKLGILYSASNFWAKQPYAVYETKEDYRKFHDNVVVPFLRNSAFKARSELQKYAAEFIRPLYARRMDCSDRENSAEFLDFRSPELKALRAGSKLWAGWYPSKPCPSKSDVAAAICEAMPDWLPASKGLLENGPKIVQLEAADTGRERQSNNRTKRP